MALKLDPNFNDPDGFYAALIKTHEGLSEEQSNALNARLIMLLANHIGDIKILRQALEVAAQK